MAASFKVYIDESGDEGFAFGKGSSEWFVLSAVVTHSADDIAAVKIVDEVRSRLGLPPRRPLHFRDLRHEQRLVLVDAVASQPIRVVSVLVRKPSLTEPERFRERYRLYYYSTRYLLERVSWYCRDHRPAHDSGDATADIVFSNRSGMSYDDLRQYLRLLESRTGVFDVEPDWRVIRPEQVAAFRPGQRRGLQVADAVAGSFYYAVQANRYGFTESRYARMLRPVVYQREGRYLGFGIKLFPPEVHEMVNTDERLAWLKGDYQ